MDKYESQRTQNNPQTEDELRETIRCALLASSGQEPQALANNFFMRC
jgi:hypothetical protein